MARVGLFAGFLLAPLCLSAAAAPVGVDENVPDAAVVGEGRLTWMIWDAYDATLYAPGGEWSPDEPYALMLSYLRTFDGEDITETSVEEILRQGFSDGEKIESWRSAMAGIFPDVEAGDQILGVRAADGRSLFYGNGEYLGAVDDADFADYFFAIWLGEGTVSPTLRSQLLGEGGG